MIYKNITNHWREIFDPSAQIFLNLNVISIPKNDYYEKER
jgi:hypothetical protein